MRRQREISGAKIALKEGVYRHSKTSKLYLFIGTALHTETSELLVVYRPLYESEHEFFVRPLEMFSEEVELDGRLVPRFVKVDDERV